MKNTQYQKLESILNSATSKELETYMQNNKINRDLKNMLNIIAKNKPETHRDKLTNPINEQFNKALEGYYKLGQAWIIAFVLECFYDNKYKISDLKSYLKAFIDNDSQLKEYVYEYMKDF